MLDLNNTYFLIYWSGRGFGDKLFFYLFSLTLEDNGIKSISFSKGHELFNLYSQKKYPNLKQIFVPDLDYTDVYKTKVIKDTMMSLVIKDFKKRFNISQDIILKRNSIPVIFYDIPDIPFYDVIINSKSKLGRKNWPYFDLLKQKLKSFGITCIDLDEKNIRNIECLNYVKKSKLYVGLDSGASHYVSSFANNKTLIIQSGFSTFDFWCNYDYNYISSNVDCSPCLEYNTIKCEKEHKCMKNISVDMVFEKIIEKLDTPQK